MPDEKRVWTDEEVGAAMKALREYGGLKYSIYWEFEGYKICKDTNDASNLEAGRKHLGARNLAKLPVILKKGCEALTESGAYVPPSAPMECDNIDSLCGKGLRLANLDREALREGVRHLMQHPEPIITPEKLSFAGGLSQSIIHKFLAGSSESTFYSIDCMRDGLNQIYKDRKLAPECADIFALEAVGHAALKQHRQEEEVRILLNSPRAYALFSDAVKMIREHERDDWDIGPETREDFARSLDISTEKLKQIENKRPVKPETIRHVIDVLSWGRGLNSLLFRARHVASIVSRDSTEPSR